MTLSLCSTEDGGASWLLLSERMINVLTYLLACMYRGGGERGEASGGGRAAQGRHGGRGEGDRRSDGRARSP